MTPKRKYKILGGIVILLHVVGAFGCMIESLKPIMLTLTPVNLLISAGVLIYSDEEAKSKIFTLVILSFFIGFIVEVVGVQTGVIFGSYEYGETLGFKAFDVPLIIGVNWFILTYLFGSLSNYLHVHRIVKILLAALGMVLLDFFIEPVAIFLDYWNWESSKVPFQNYIGWFIIAFILQIIYNMLGLKKINKVVISLFLAQLAFFMLLLFFVI